jgi:hypothetical protein
MQHEIMYAKHDVVDLYKFKNPYHFVVTRLEQAMTKGASKVKEYFQDKLVKLLLIANPKLGFELFQ